MFTCYLPFGTDQVAENRCWSCGLSCQSNLDLQHHLHKILNLNDIKALWDDDKYLKPFKQNDPLLYSFAEDEEDDDETTRENLPFHANQNQKNGMEDCTSASHGYLNAASSLEAKIENTVETTKTLELKYDVQEDNQLKIARQIFDRNDIKNANENYFGSYGSFGIHREMLSDKVLYYLSVYF